jgi:hypothetical protein
VSNASSPSLPQLRPPRSASKSSSGTSSWASSAACCSASLKLKAFPASCRRTSATRQTIESVFLYPSMLPWTTSAGLLKTLLVALLDSTRSYLKQSPYSTRRDPTSSTCRSRCRRRSWRGYGRSLVIVILGSKSPIRMRLLSCYVHPPPLPSLRLPNSTLLYFGASPFRCQSSANSSRSRTLLGP